MNKQISFLLLCLCCACSGKTDHSIPHAQFEKTISLTGTKLTHDVISLPPAQMELIDSCLILFQPGGVAAKVISTEDAREKGVFGQFGRGPDEFLNPFFAGYNRSDSVLAVYDIAYKALKFFRWTPSIPDGSIVDYLYQKNYTGTMPLFFCSLLDNDYLACRTISPEHGGVLVLLDSTMSIRSVFCNPLNVAMKDLTPYLGVFDNHDNRFVYAMMHMGYIVSYVVGPNGEVKKEWEWLLSEPVYKTSPQFSFVEEKNKQGFYDVKMTSRYIYTAYSGKTVGASDYLPASLLVFDLLGNPVIDIQLNRPFGRFAISEDDQTAYIFDSENGGCIIKYDLSAVWEGSPG